MTLPPFTGHEDLRASLARATDRGELPATLLIHGGPGCGKQALALWLAQLRLCEDRTGIEPCGTCQSCRFSLRLEHPDVHWYFPLARPKGAGSPDKLAQALEAARQERLAELRSNPLGPANVPPVRGLYLAQVLGIRRAAQKRPTLGDEQVFIIGDAEYLVPQEASPEAANALLKLLEEPPRGSRFILTSSRPESLLETIRSRSLEIHLPPLPESSVAAFLESHRGVSPPEAREAARKGRGSIGLALAELDPEGDAPTRRADALALLRSALEGPKDAHYAQALSYAPAGARGLLDLLSDLQYWIRDLGAAALGSRDHVMGREELAALQEAGARLGITPPVAARAVDRVERTRILAEANVNPQLLISTLLLDLHDTFHANQGP